MFKIDIYMYVNLVYDKVGIVNQSRKDGFFKER